MNKAKIRFKKIITEQFAIIDTPLDGNVAYSSKIQFGKIIEDRLIAVKLGFRFLKDDHPFIILETVTFFEVDEEGWQGVLKEDDTIEIEKNFSIYLASLAVGLARGILHAKTENTEYNGLILPLINIGEEFKEDTFVL